MKTNNAKRSVLSVLMIVAFGLVATVASALDVQEAEPNNDFAGAQNVDDSFSIGARYGVENSEVWPWVSIRGTGDGTLDFYSFVVPAGVVHGVFDIDFSTNLDSVIDLHRQLPDGSIVLLAADNNNSGDPGSLPGESTAFDLDSRLYFTFNFPEPGTYFIRVGRFCCPAPLNIPGQAYTLNITLSDHGGDDEPPTITCPPALTVQCAAEVPAPDFDGGTAADDHPGVIVEHVDDATVPGRCPNSFVVMRTYRATDISGNTADCTQIIAVSDMTPPVLSGCPEPTDSVSCLADVPVAPVVTAVDNCSAIVTVQFSETQSNPGSSCNNVITRTWIAMDECGNTNSCTQTITVDDRVSPNISSPPDVVVTAGSVPPAARSVAEFVAQGGNADDRCGSDLLVTSSDSTVGGCSTMITRTYTVMDACGNASVSQQTITVIGSFANDAIVWQQPLARNGASEDTDPGGAGSLKYRFKVGSVIPIKIRALGCAGSDATGNGSVIGIVEVLGDTNCDEVSDGNKEPIGFNGIGGPGGMMQKVDGYLRYNLDTKQLPRTSRCHILRVTVTNTATGESRWETVPLQGK